MKNNSLIALALAFFIFMAWYKVLIMPTEEVNSTEDLKRQAETYAENGAPEIAFRLYQQILSIKDTIENREIMFRYLQTCLEEGSIEFGKKDMRSFVIDTMEQYGSEEFSYEIAMEYWTGEKNYSKCEEIMESAILNNAVSEVMQSLYDEVKYTYRVNSDKYGQVLNYSEGILPVLGGRGWAFCNADLTPLFQSEFDVVTICNDSYVITRKGEYIKVFNTAGQVVGVFDANGYEVAGALGNGRIPLVKDNRYIYVSVSGEVLSEEFEIAGVYESGLAAVKEDNEWKIINTKGEEILAGLDGVVLDEDNRCLAYGLLIVKRADVFIMYDEQGNEVGRLDVDDVKLFGNGKYAAACKAGKWGFIDKTGQWIMEPVYDDARSFWNGFAAVCMEGKWGYIDEQGDIVVEYLFEDARDFTEQKLCMVYQNGYWSSLELLCK